jgi:hypothetical protein
VRAVEMTLTARMNAVFGLNFNAMVIIIVVIIRTSPDVPELAFG